MAHSVTAHKTMGLSALGIGLTLLLSTPLAQAGGGAGYGHSGWHGYRHAGIHVASFHGRHHGYRRHGYRHRHHGHHVGEVLGALVVGSVLTNLIDAAVRPRTTIVTERIYVEPVGTRVLYRDDAGWSRSRSRRDAMPARAVLESTPPTRYLGTWEEYRARRD